MHGRLLTIPATLLMMAFAAAPAVADQTIGLGQAADADGVVTLVTNGGSATQVVQLGTVQALGGGGSRTTATSDAVTVAPGESVRMGVPIAAGGTLTLPGASDPSSLTVRVESDADGDGDGDTTQDSCPADFTSRFGPCATQSIGSPLTLAPDPRGFSGSGNPLQARQSVAPGVRNDVAADGILTHWRTRTTTAAGPTVLQVLRPFAGATYTVVAESAPVDPSDDGVVALPAAIAVRAGDILAARSVSGDVGAVAYRAGDTLATRQPPGRLGDPAFAVSTTYNDRRLLVQADVEPDADGDGKGDVSQDSADLALTGEAIDGEHVYRLENRGPDAALRVVVRIESGADGHTASPGWSCTRSDQTERSATTTCTIAALAPGARAEFEGHWLETVTATTYATRSRASANALTPDPDQNNNWPQLGTSIALTPPTAPAQQPFKVIACANVVRGTRDDDVLRGTLFGDRLVGNDGDDLLKGAGGDDCLEGGAGDDVMDGGDGNDRLAGSSGKDRLTGGNGNDKLTGGKGNDRLTGGNGNDTLSPGDGKDIMSAGPGNDTINSVDGVRETVDCGAGRDTVRADKRDRLLHCEKVTRRK